MQITSEPRLRVLVVDDDPDATESLSILLGLWGHQARIATDGRAALAAVADEPPDVILLDLGLPGMSGWEVAHRVHEMEWEKRPFIVAVTGFADEAARAISGNAGIDLHLTMPVELRVLAELLERFRVALV